VFCTAFVNFGKNAINLKKILFFTFILLSCNNKETSNSKSISTLFEKNKNLSQQYKNDYLDSIFLESNEITNDSTKLKTLFEIAAEYYYLENNTSSLKVSKEAYTTSVILKDSINMGRALYYIGDCYLDFQKDSAYYYYKESEKIFRKINNSDRLAKVLYNKAYLLYYEGNYVESEIEVIKALNLLKNEKNLLYQYRCYSLQGSNLLELGEYDKALEYFDLSAAILNQMKKNDIDKDTFYDYEITNTIDLCTAYDKKGEYAESIKLLKEVIKKGNFINYSKLHYSVLGNLAYSLMKNNQYEESRKYFVESIKLANDKNDKLGYLYKIIDFGEYHLLTKDTLKAKELFNEALLLSKKLNNGKEILKSLGFLSVADKTNASNYKTEYIRINDSITKKQRENREKFARIEYETDKVEEENKILSNKNLLLLSGLSISIAVFSIILIIRNRIARKKERYFVQQKEKANEELSNITKEFQFGLVKAKEQEQDRISKELHDGIVNQIYGIRMILGSLNKNTDEESQKKRSEYLKELHKLETEIRALSHDLNSDFSKYIGEFKFLLEQLIQKNNEIGNTIFNLDISSTIDWNTYSSLIKINIYRILQELLQNVNKYAEAKNCYVGISIMNNNLMVEVKDNGKGFDAKNLSTGIGINNIKKRVKTINADLIIESNNSEGSRFHITIKI
jgi:signal transduction histidine kinase